MPGCQMLFPPNPEQKKILKEFCEQEVEAQTRFVTEKYGLKDYKPQLYLNFRPNGVANYGGELADGEPFVSILGLEVCGHVGKTGKFVYEEYDFLQNKDGIGNGVANWKQHVSWTIAHEMAHTVVEIDRFRESAKRFYEPQVIKDLRAHGMFWQSVYRDIRVGFCSEDRYPVESIDYSNVVFSYSRRRNDREQITFYKGERPIAWYIRESGKLFRSNRSFGRKSPTKYRNTGEIRRKLT